MGVHDELADLARTAGHQVFDEADSFRAAVDDFLPEGSLSTGELNLLVDGVRMQALARLLSTLEQGADPAAAIDLHGDRLARDRGTAEAGGARWALAVLGFALGRIDESEVQRRHQEMTSATSALRPGSPSGVTQPTAPDPTETVRPAAGYPVAPPPRQTAGPASMPTAAPASMPTAAPAKAPPAAPTSPPTESAPPPHAPPAPESRRSGSRRAMPAISLILAIVVGVVGAGGAGVLLANAWREDDAPAEGATDAPPTSSPSASPTSASTSEPPRSSSSPVESRAPDPLGVGYPQENLACDTGYIVVLTSTESSTPAMTVRNALDRFPRAQGRAYLDPAASCWNLSHLVNKVNLKQVPYIGPYPDAVAACEARMAVADTTTYVIGVQRSATEATYCACSYDDAALPLLNQSDDSDPTGNNRFWTLELQYMLWEAGYNPQRLVPGKFGSQTASFVEQLQSDHALTTSGSMDAATWRVLKARVC